VTDRETDRQKDGWVDDGWTDRQTESHEEREAADTLAGKQGDRQTLKCTATHTDTDRQKILRYNHRLTDRQTDRKAE
jgi:hypothetical protein